MKNHVFILLLAISISITGCGKDNDTQAAEQAQEAQADGNVETQTSDDEIEESTEPEEIVGISYSNEGTFDVPYEEDVSMEYNFSYSVPMINDDSDDATAINDEINGFAKGTTDVIEDILNDRQDEFYPPQYGNIEFESYENGDIVSIVMRGESLYVDWVDYYVVNYNKATKQRATNDEILEMVGISEEEYIERARGSLGKCLSSDFQNFVNFDEDVEEGEDISWRYRMIADFAKDFAQTIGDQNVNNNMMMYLDGDGDISVVALIYVPAGAGQYYYNVKIEDVAVSDVAKLYTESAEKYYYDGFEKDCLGLFDVEGYSGEITHNAGTGNEYSESVYLGFLDTDPTVFVLQYAGDGYSIGYTGNIKFIDVDENGMKFEYEFTERDFKPIDDTEKPFAGEFYLMPFSYYDEATDDYMQGAVYTYSDGDDMLDSSGETIELEKSFG